MAAYDLRPNRVGQLTVPRTQGATNLANFMRLEQDRRNAADKQRLQDEMFEWQKGAQDRADQRTLDINKNVADQIRLAEQGLIENFAFDEDARNQVFQSKQFKSLPPEVQAEMQAEGYFKNRLGKDLQISQLVGANQYEQALRNSLANTRLGIDARNKIVENVMRQKGLSRTQDELDLYKTLIPGLASGGTGISRTTRKSSGLGPSEYEKRDRLGNPNVGMKLDEQLKKAREEFGISDDDPLFGNWFGGADDVSRKRFNNAFAQYASMGFNPSTFPQALGTIMEDDAELANSVSFDDFMSSLSNPPKEGQKLSEADRLAKKFIQAGQVLNREEFDSAYRQGSSSGVRAGVNPQQLLTAALQFARPQAATSENQAKLLLSLLPQVQAVQQQQQQPPQGTTQTAPTTGTTQQTTANTANAAPQGNPLVVPSEQPKTGVMQAGLDMLVDAAIPGSINPETAEAIKSTARGVQDAAYTGLTRDTVPNLGVGPSGPISGRIFNMVDEIRNQYGDDINQVLARGQQTGSDVLNTLANALNPYGAALDDFTSATGQIVENVSNMFNPTAGRIDEMDINAPRYFPQMDTNRLRSLLAKFEGVEGYEKQVAQLKEVLASRQ